MDHLFNLLQLPQHRPNPHAGHQQTLQRWLHSYWWAYQDLCGMVIKGEVQRCQSSASCNSFFTEYFMMSCFPQWSSANETKVHLESTTRFSSFQRKSLLFGTLTLAEVCLCHWCFLLRLNCVEWLSRIKRWTHELSRYEDSFNHTATVNLWIVLDWQVLLIITVIIWEDSDLIRRFLPHTLPVVQHVKGQILLHG